MHRLTRLSSALVLAVGIAAAGERESAAQVVVPPPPIRTPTPPALKGQQLPDLVIRDITLDGRCQVVVKAGNLGPGRVPDAVWTTHTPSSSSVYLTIDGRGWGGETIWKFDPGRGLQNAGGTATYASTYVVSGSASVKATIDHTGQVAEVNEGNNALVRALTCQGGQPTSGQLPDLIPILHEPMDGTVGVRNIGAAPSGPTKLTLDCRKEGHTGGGGGCPDAPGLASFTDPAFPDVVTVRVPPLRPGETHLTRLPFWPSLHWTSGRYLFTATADAGRTERESNEGNNVQRSSLTVP